jgi:hypothetical protein
MSELDDHPGWKWCTAEGSREYNYRLTSTLSAREKLEWLEDSETLILRFRESARRATEGVK